MDLKDQSIASEIHWVTQLCPANTCMGRCGSISDNCTISCNCDSGCVLLNDCCPDFFQVCPDEVTKNSTDAMDFNIHSMMQYMTQHDTFYEKILWVDKCPPNANNVVEEKCTKLTYSRFTIEQYIPVISNGFIFRNRYCALCHNQSHIEDYLKLLIMCKQDTYDDLVLSATFGDKLKVFDLPLPELNKLSGDNQCYFVYILQSVPVSVLRFLTSSYEIRSCSAKVPGSRAELLTLCDSYRSEVAIGNDGYTHMTAYSNPHCALCNGVAVTEEMTISCVSYKCNYVKRAGNPVFSFSILIDVTLIGSVIQDIDLSIGNDRVCRIGELENILSSLCQPVPCPFGLATNGSSPCSIQYKSTTQILEHNADDKFTAILKFPTNIRENLNTRLLMNILSAMKSSDLIKSLTNYDEHFDCSLLPLEKDGIHREEFDENFVCMIISFVPIKYQLREVFIFFSSQIYESNEDNITITLYNFDILQETNCHTGKEIINYRTTLFHRSVNNVMEEYVYVEDAGLYWPATSVPIKISLLVTGRPISDIPLNTTISAKVCVIEADTTPIDPSNANVEVVLTLVCNIVSLLALAFTFFSLVFFPIQKSTIRILLINLVISLFCAQTLFCIQELFLFQFQLCRIAGILQHYMWLTYFFLMNSIALDVALRFRNLESLVKARSENDGNGLCIGLLMYSFLGPLFLVSPGVILDVVSETALSPQYGQGKACWINNNSALLYLFVIPFSSIVVLNTFLVVSAIWGIYKISGQNQVISQEHSYFWTNIKMSSLMGLSWGLGLVAYYTQLAPVRYAFIVFNTLQGVVIFCSFGLTKKVINYMCNP